MLVATQNVADAHETLERALAKESGVDQEDPFQVKAFPSLSTMAQKDVVGHDTL
jgi:hypothetical protein